MRIVVVNTAASSGGALSTLRDFYEYVKNDIDNEWIFILSDYYIKETDNVRVIVNQKVKSNWYNRLKWEIRDGSKFINNLYPDIVFSMQNTISRGINSKSVIYLHQSIPFQDLKRFSFLKKRERQLAIYQYIIGGIIKNSLKRTDKIIVQTNWMKKAVIKDTGIKEERITVVPPNVSKIDHQIRTGYLKENRFFYPATGAVYKNHECIINVAKKLVKLGINDFVIDLTLPEEYKKILNITPEIENNIRFLGSLSREEVFEKYQNSILLFPSYIETFGLPLLEARNAGSFIIASHCEFAKEVLQGYKNVKYFNPFEDDELLKIIIEIINKEYYYEYDDSRIENKLGWEVTVKEIEKVIKFEQ